MNAAEQINPVIDRLGSVLDRGNLPPPYDRWGARLLAHLTKPVQVVVTGFDGSGKTALIEMMAAQPVFGSGFDAPLVELAYGETETAVIERADGSITSAAGLLRNIACPGDAIRVRQEVPDTRLIQQEFIEIGLQGSPAQKRAAIEMAIARADVMIWCSQEFDEEEQRLWALVPDHVKDHSVLALTMADRQLMRSVLADTIERLEPIVAEEFLGMFPVATIQGITAQTCADEVDEALWASSGGMYLMDLVTRQITQGRTADMDQARIFMDRLALRMPQIASDVVETPDPEAPDDDALAARSQTVTMEALPEAVACDPQAVAVLSEAMDLLQQHANRMLDDMDDGEELDADRILNGCSEAINSVADLLEARAMAGPAAEAMRDDVEEGEEMLMLFQLERGEDAALDAVTLLLQIRKELADKLAV